MKILFIRETELKELTPDIENSVGVAGTENSVIHLAEALSNLGHQVAICCPCPTQRKYGNVIYIPFDGYWRVQFLLMTYNPDVTIVAGNPKIIFSEPSLFMNRKTVFWMQNHPEEFSLPIAKLEEFPKMKIVCASPEAAEYTRGFFNNRLIIHGIYNGIRPQFFNQNGTKTRNKIVYVGSFSRTKGLLTLLQTEGLTEYRIHLCGSFSLYGWSDPEYERMCRSFYNQPGIIQEGSLPPQKLAEQMASAELCIVNPIVGNKETCCVSALEAMACGTCVLAGGNSIIDPIITHGGISYTRNLVGSIHAIMYNDKKRKATAIFGHEWSKNLTWDNMAQKWMEIIK